MLASELLTQVRALGMLPTASTAALDDPSLLQHADMVVQTRLLPVLRRINEEYLVTSVDLTAVNGRIEMPNRATASAIRLLQLITPGGGLRPLPRLTPEQSPGYPTSLAYPVGFYFDGGGIVLQPDGSGGTVRLRYYMRPGLIRTMASLGALSGTEPGGLITQVQADTPVAGSTMLTFSSIAIPSWTGTVSADIISQGPAHDVTNVGISGSSTATTLTVLTSAIARTIRVGDYVYPSGYTPVVPVPEELSGVLVGLTSARALMAMGYQSESSQQASDAEHALNQVELLMRPRSEGNPKRLTGGILGQLGRVNSWRGW